MGFRKISISKNNYFASCVMQLLFRNHYFAKLLFRKTTISQKKKTISKPLFRKTTISKNNYLAELLFRNTIISRNFNFMEQLFRKQLFRITTISKNNYFASCVMQLLFRNHYFAKL